MKPVPASLVAVIASWGVMLAGWAIARNGEDAGFMAYWTAIFTLLAWSLVVRPVIDRFVGCRLLCDPRWNWLGWSAMGAGTYLLFLLPLAGRQALALLWYPLTMAVLAGLGYALLRHIGQEPGQ